MNFCFLEPRNEIRARYFFFRKISVRTRRQKDNYKNIKCVFHFSKMAENLALPFSLPKVNTFILCSSCM
jgi:hypothetical protein